MAYGQPRGTALGTHLGLGPGREEVVPGGRNRSLRLLKGQGLVARCFPDPARTVGLA